MGKILISILIILLFLVDPLCNAQTSVKVSDPRLEIRDNKLLISYDILYSDPEEKYIISIEIKDEKGNLIKANTLEGDIGEITDGRENKQVIWSFEADNVFLDEYVSVQINAKVILPPASPVIEEPEEKVVLPEPVKQTIPREGEPPPISTSKTYSRTGIVFQSIAFPGLGLSRVTGNPHWIRGVAGYGCVITSIVLNWQAIKTYDGIDDFDYFYDVIDVFDKSLLLDNISEIFSFAAVGIWVTDIIWTLAGTSDLNMKPRLSQNRGFSFETKIDPLSKMPLLSFNLRF